MEVLQHSLKRIKQELLTDFQIKIWDILSPLLEKLITDQLSNESSIEKGLGVDIFLRLNLSDFILYISITDDCLYINSKYFDFYIYPETEMDKVELLLKQVLLGKYSISLSYGKSGKLVYRKLLFESKELKGFNEDQRVGIFKRKIKTEKMIKGVKLIDA